MSTTSRPAPGSGVDRWSIDTLAEYIGLTALASAALLIAGLAFTSAYLSAWEIPLSAVQVDPVAAALRSDAAVYDALLMGAVALLAQLALRRVKRAGRARTLATAAGTAVAVGLGVVAGVLLYWGVALAIGAGILIAFGRQQGWLRGWRLVAVVAIGALLSGYATGFSVGRQTRDDETRQTPILLTTAVPVAGLDDGVEEGSAWHYDRLYFVYRDAAAVYVSRPGGGPVAWAIAEFNLRSVALGTAR